MEQAFLMAAPRPPQWPAGVAVARRAVPARAPVPVCEAWVLPIGEARRWAKAAKAGDVLVYARGPSLIRGETSAFVRALAEGGAADLFQARAEGCYGFDFKLRMREAPSLDGARGRSPDPAPDEAMECIFRALERCAARRRRAYSDAELARIAGLATRDQARWRLRKLAEAGRIGIETVTGPDNLAWRIVSVGGRRTAAPPVQREGEAR